MKMSIKIYADHGSYSSVREAAFAEKSIDWWDKNNPLCDICTESFAAYKLYDYLTKAGIENISLADGPEDIGKAGCSIVITGNMTKESLPTGLGLDQNKEIQKLTSKDGYVIQAWPDSKTILLYGNSRIAVLYAMYHYLKLQGFAFISPDAQGFIIPNLVGMVPLKETIVEQPDYKTRGFLSSYSDDSNEQFLEWTVANRLDYMSLHVNNNHFVKKLGIKLTGGGHQGMYEYLPPDQPDPNFIPAKGEAPKTYFETHPEWFALRNGKREQGVSKGNQEKGYYTGNNFCMSNEDAVNEFCKNYLNSIISGSLQYTDFINIWPLDNGKWCECEECAKMGNYTRQILVVAYKLSKAIKEATKKGLLKRDEVLQLQKSCTVLINPRPKNGEYTKYSFPSKIMEYMSSGTPVIAYKLEGIPEEYYEHIYMVNDDKGGLFGTLKDVLCKDEQELFRKGQIAKEFVLTQKSGEKQGEKILQMLNHL